MATYIKLVTAGGEQTLENIVSFTFEKERYRCYTVFSATAIGVCEPENVIEVWFYLNDKLLHRGTADSLVSERTGSSRLIKVRSFSFTMSLGQTELEPGIVGAATLVKLAQRSKAPLGYCSWQSDTPEVNYVYINEHTTLWEAVCVYTAKAFDSYPFIKAQNTVWCDRSGGTSRDYSGEMISEMSSGVALSNLISEAYTVDNDNEWTIGRKDNFAVSRRISKQRYYSRDLEWSYDPAAGLKYHMGIAAGGRQYKQFTYVGYKGEELCDRAELSLASFSIANGEVDGIKITGSVKGIFTTISCYTDVYCG